tara:strand:+ start:429 stop:1118 length:690 start_codon:yes stop_codon:yes gene_type:complete
MKSLPFIWLPLLSLWTILIVLFSNRTIQNIELYIPLVIYFVVSLVFAFQLGLINKTKKENFLVKFSSSNSLLFCFLISTISIFSYLYGGINLQISLLLVIAPLIANLIFNEIFSISSKQIGKQKDKLIIKKNNWVEKGKELEQEQIKKSKEKSKARDLSKGYKKEWKTYLKKASASFSNNQEIINEIDRIKDILEFSSFFRKSDCMEDLYLIKLSEDELEVLAILKDIK